MPAGASHITGFVCSKDRMVRGLYPYAKPNKRMTRIMATKRKIEELEMLFDILKLTAI